MGTTWLSQTGGARLLPDSEGPLQELDPQDPVTQCTAGAGSQTNLMIPEAATRARSGANPGGVGAPRQRPRESFFNASRGPSPLP